MAQGIATFGNLRADDDYMHPPSGDPSFNESMFFNFFDNDQRLAGIISREDVMRALQRRVGIKA